MVNLQQAYRACEREARRHYENFPVASVLVARHMRPHIAAVYAFARAADDFADEGERTVAERCRLLDGWAARLRDCVQHDRLGAPAADGEPAHAPLIFLALGATIRACALPPALFEDLLSAFRQDVTIWRYDTWGDLLDYCRRSANPVGRLVLRIAGDVDDRMDRQSDAMCTALQLTNFWLDLGIDYARGRVYVPAEEMRAHGASTEDLAAPHLNGAWQQTLGAAVARTRVLFDLGRPLCDEVRGRLRYELRATWLGGVRILDRLESSACDPLRLRPRLTMRDAPALAWQAVTWP